MMRRERDPTMSHPRLFGDHFLHSLTDDEQAVVRRVRGLCRDTLGPNAAEVAKQDVFAWDNFRPRSPIQSTSSITRHPSTGPL